MQGGACHIRASAMCSRAQKLAPQKWAARLLVARIQNEGGVFLSALKGVWGGRGRTQTAPKPRAAHTREHARAGTRSQVKSSQDSSLMHTIHMTIHRGLQVAEVGHCERPRGIVGRRRRCALLVLWGGCGSLVAGPRITLQLIALQLIPPLVDWQLARVHRVHRVGAAGVGREVLAHRRREAGGEVDVRAADPQALRL